jgi:RIO-like serine/threonine protein kinase
MAGHFGIILGKMDGEQILKCDLFGEVVLRQSDAGPVIVRNAAAARWWVRWLARYLLKREAKVLAALEGFAGVPQLLRHDRDTLVRSYLAGEPMHKARPSDPDLFKQAASLLRRLHRAGVCHNDLAKEPNVLVLEDGNPALIDFQLAWYSPRRSKLFRIAAREDIRHLLKHKRTYCPERLTSRERAILTNPAPVSRAWAGIAKPVYLFITRRVLGWADREGAGDRGARK